MTTASKYLETPVQFAFSALYPDDYAILEFPKFAEAMEKNGYVLESEGQPFDLDTATFDLVEVVDPETDEKLLIFCDDVIDVEVRLTGFLEVLTAVDEYCKSVHGMRIFDDPTWGHPTTNEPSFNWRFDFVTQSYVGPNGERPKDVPPTLKEVTGMTTLEYIENMNI
jgi:hypothetical protein